MQTNTDGKPLRLRRIPDNTVVYTPTKAEAKELLAILHENGWRWQNNKALNDWQFAAQAYRLCRGRVAIGGFTRLSLGLDASRFITIAKFKERYCEDEKPKPMFIKGQKVRITNKKHTHYGHKGKVGEVISYDPKYDRYKIDGIPSEWEPEDLEPCTEPETKDEAKENRNLSQNSAEKCDNDNAISTDEIKELNLCELLKGHEGGVFYSPIYGEVTIEFDKERGLIEMWPLSKRAYLPIATNGHLANNPEKGQCLIFPSRTLYEQYPLDPYTAWQKWQEEQKKYTLCIDMAHFDYKQSFVSSKTCYFRTSADRDKCLSEIKAIINKYSK